MFWENSTNTPQSSLGQLLEQEPIDLVAILNDDYVLQELKTSNVKLIEYFCRPEIINQTLQYALNEPDSSVEDTKRYKLSHLCSELLSSGEEHIVAVLLEDNEVKRQLLTFTSGKTIINPLLASFFSHIICSLMYTKAEETLALLKNEPNFIANLIQHLNCSAFTEILIRAVCSIDNQHIQDQYKDWLVESEMAKHLVKLFTNDYSNDAHQNSSSVLCDTIKQLRENLFQKETKTPDQLLDQIQEFSLIDSLLEHLLSSQNESIISNVVDVFLTLLTCGYSLASAAESPQGESWNPDPSFVTVRVMLKHLERVHAILRDENVQIGAQLPSGGVIKPLGRARLYLIRLIVSLVLNNVTEVHEKCSQLETLQLVLSYFRNYERNSFLHTATLQLFSAVLYSSCHSIENGSGDKTVEVTVSPLLTDLIEKCQIIGVILEICAAKQNNKTVHVSYYGHVMMLADNIIRARQDEKINSKAIESLFSDLSDDLKERWTVFESKLLPEYQKLNEPDSVAVEHSKSLEMIPVADADEFPLANIQQYSKDFNDYQSLKPSIDLNSKVGFDQNEFITSVKEPIGPSKESLFEVKTNACRVNINNKMQVDKIVSEIGSESNFDAICMQRGKHVIASLLGEVDDDAWNHSAKQNSFQSDKERSRKSSSDSDSGGEAMETDESNWANFGSAFETKAEAQTSKPANHNASNGVPNDPFSSTTTTNNAGNGRQQDNWADFSDAPIDSLQLEDDQWANFKSVNDGFGSSADADALFGSSLEENQSGAAKTTT